MSSEPGARASVTSLALATGIVVFVVAASALAAVQGVDTSSTRACVVAHWEPARGLPWALVAALPSLVYMLVVARAMRRRTPPITLGEGPYRQSVLDEPLRGDRPRSHLYVRGLCVVLALAAGIAASRRSSCPYAVPSSCHPKTARIAIMAVGTVEHGLVDDLAKHFRDCYGLPVTVAPALEAPRAAYDAEREQWRAEALLAAMPGCHDGDPLCDGSTLTIGVTSDDIYTTHESWRYAFTIRDSARHTAILSTSRMSSFGRSTANVRKMVAKTIALECCDLPPVSNPRSVRYDAIMGPDALEAIDESVW